MKQKLSKVTVRIDDSLKQHVLKFITKLKRENPEHKFSVNELVKNFLIEISDYRNNK